MLALKHVFRFGQFRLSVFTVAGESFPALSTNAAASFQLDVPGGNGVDQRAGWNFQSFIHTRGERTLLFETRTSGRAAAVARPIGEIVRVHHYYGRDSGPVTEYWREFGFRRTGTALLGLGENPPGPAQVGIEVANLAGQFRARFERDGVVETKNPGLLGLRIDYRVGTNFVASVFFHDGLAGPPGGLALPWGTKKNRRTKSSASRTLA